jgi:hypothetical protein
MASAERSSREVLGDASLGIAWWNAMTEAQRAEALRSADSACPADAWKHWQQTAAGFKCEELAHG